MKRLPSLLTIVFAACSPLSAQVEPAEEPAVKAVGLAMPAVVNINTESVIRRPIRTSFDSAFNDYYGGSMRVPRVIKQKVQSLGSGFFVDATGYLVTNAHVVERAAELKISVTTQDGKTYTAKYITGDKEHDLALLKVDGQGPFPYLSLSALSPNLLGQTCLVLGNPVGYGSSVARGILSAKGRTVSIGETEYQNLLQTDAAINPGNSGGPIVDLAGRLMGVSSVKMSFTPQGVPTQGLAFAIPANVVREKVTEFTQIARGEKPAAKPSLSRKYFGVSLQNLDDKMSESFGFRVGAGVLISEVEPDSPAAKAGIESGMLISSIGRYDIVEAKEVEKLFEQIDSGSRVDFGVSWYQGKGRSQRLAGDTFQVVAR